MKKIKNMRLSFSLVCLFAALCATPVMAQKQSKVEKLLKFLVNNESEKFTKNRSKLDAETAGAFEAEVKLIDICHQLWYLQEADAAKDYFQAYVNASRGSFSSICAEADTDPSAIRRRTEEAIDALLDGSEDKLTYSDNLVAAVKASAYELSAETASHLYGVHEEELWKDFVRGKGIPKCERYLNEYADGKYKSEAMIEYNRLLFKTIKDSPSAANFKRFFDHERLNTFFDGRSNRESMAQALSLYDDYLYGNICRAQAIASIRQAIAEYEGASYLSPGDKKYAGTLEYKKDSIDYETLKLEVNAPGKLGLIKDYLLTHKYKVFRDKANRLRAPFEQQLIWSNPTTIQAYTRGLLMKSNETKNGKTVQKIYTYDNNGKPISIREIIEEKGTTTLLTNFLYDSQGNNIGEVQVNQKTQKEVYNRRRTFGEPGVILTDTTFYQNGKMTVIKYHPQLCLPVEEMHFEKNVPVSSVVTQYNADGQIAKREETFPLPKDPLPTQVSKQVDVYEYDPYGYLTKIAFEKTLVNSDKTSGSLIFLYDDFGNRIDSNAYYEYDNTGRWIQKTDRGDANNTEKIQVVY